jgi:copper chaperone NosL
MNTRLTLSRKALRVCFGSVAIVGLLMACSQSVPKALAALEPDSDTACAVDGMLLVDYPGPKGQTHYAEGKPDFYCDLMDLFAMLLAPEQKRVTTAVFVQDMGKTAWDHPTGNWIDAKQAIYVSGSSKLGSMGPTLASFSQMADAEAFVAKEGGKIVRFEKVTLDMVASNKADGMDAHDDAMH